MRRIAGIVDPGLGIKVTTVIRTPRSKLVKTGELERVVELAARKLARPAAILLLLDADTDCPAELGPSLLHRARTQRADLPIAAVLAKHEFENWFIASAESLRGLRGLPQDLTAPQDPEGIEAAKAWLSTRMPRHSPYSETIDQPALTAQFNLEMARCSRSFDKVHREIERLLAAVTVP
jgi:hypothetical protein